MPARRIDSTSQFTTAVFTLIARNRRFKVDLLGTRPRHKKKRSHINQRALLRTSVSACKIR